MLFAYKTVYEVKMLLKNFAQLHNEADSVSFFLGKIMEDASFVMRKNPFSYEEKACIE